MKEMVALNKKEQRRLMVLNEVEVGKVTVREAAEVLGLSLRHVRRIVTAYRKGGAQALAHGNRGRKPHNAFDDDLKRMVLELAQSTYTGCNTQHFTELLAEREGIAISRSTVRLILLQAGIRSPRRRRPPKHRSRRERYPQRGMLLQTDGSDHDWLEGRGPNLTLIGAIDDATGEVPYALFRDEEDTQGYIILLRQIVAEHGIPIALYHDRHSIFERSNKEPETIEEQLEGRRKPTHFGRVMEELGIVSITSLSPQARGRIERLWETFQDRLVSELRIAGASNREEANKVLWDFLPRHNQRFAIPAAEPGSAYREPPEDFHPDEVFCFKYQRTVGRDNVVRFGNQRIQIMPTNGRLSYVHARVEVHERVDGSLAVYYKGQCLATKPAPAEAPVLRARSTERVAPGTISYRETFTIGAITKRTSELEATRYTKPWPNHPWRRPFKVHIDRG
jgi:transposase